MSENVTTRRPQTDDEAYVQAAQRHYETVATKLEQLAAEIRERGGRVGSGNRTAVAHAADAMSEFTQGVGGIGSFLWGIVHDAEHLDRFRRESAASGSSGLSEQKQ
jgi:hypothetical protein